MQITLKAARINAGITQGQAAEQIGVNRQTIRIPDAVHFMKLCELYHADPYCIRFETKQHR